MAVEGQRGKGHRGAERGSTEAASRKLIVDAAQRLFADAGYAATSTAKIAGAAGVPHGLVFYYFPSKRDLLLTVVGERAYRRTLLEPGAEAGHRDVVEVLSAAAHELVEVFRENRDTQVILFREAGTDPEMHTLVSELVASSTGDVATLLADAKDAPADAKDRLAAARLLVSSLLMDNFLHDGIPERGRIDDTVRLLAAGLHRRSTREDQ